MTRKIVFKPARRHPLDDWLEHLAHCRKAWGEPLGQNDFQLHICAEGDQNDPNRHLHAQAGVWFYAGGREPVFVREGIYHIAEVPSILWMLRGRIHIFCTQRTAEELGLVVSSLPTTVPELAAAL